MNKLTPEEFRLLKDRLYRASNALALSLKSCPELGRFSLPLSDGHQLSLNEVTSWLEAARAECWKFGPSKVQLRHLKKIVKQQPRG